MCASVHSQQMRYNSSPSFFVGYDGKRGCLPSVDDVDGHKHRCGFGQMLQYSKRAFIASRVILLYHTGVQCVLLPVEMFGVFPKTARGRVHLYAYAHVSYGPAHSTTVATSRCYSKTFDWLNFPDKRSNASGVYFLGYLSPPARSCAKPTHPFTPDDHFSGSGVLFLLLQSIGAHATLVMTR